MGKIIVNFQHDRGLVYDANDYFRLRSEFRIVGNLIGVPVSHPRNINQQGLPAVLSTVELKFLLSKNAIELVDRNAAFMEVPNAEQIHLHESLVRKQKEEIRQPVIEKRMEAFRKHLPKILEGKRKKLLKSGMKNEDIKISAEQLLAEEMEKIRQEKFDTLVQIPTKYQLNIETTTPEPKFLPNAEDLIKYQVFESLWNDGGFITSGDAFGCDFLLYPGDPICFHASHMCALLVANVDPGFEEIFHSEQLVNSEIVWVVEHINACERNEVSRYLFMKDKCEFTFITHYRLLRHRQCRHHAGQHYDYTMM
ncbi:AGAP011885-PA-like protein [Anopheles sinensis]|uniref:tRNA-intron lyase n=1 Tax=Anopheles sinensis TaxID=74873 RepID=A0A084WIP1_ANOSI|nr:AGAP011885-PA-like protein [Anopheles sinensis]